MENMLENTLRTWEHTGNLIGTDWELIGNFKGTHCEPGKNEKKIPYHPWQRTPYLLGYLLFCFILIHWVCLTSQTFLFLQQANLIGPLQQKVETMEAPQNRRFYGMIMCLSLWPSYIGEKRRTWAKHMGLKWGAIGNTLGEHIGNLLRTWREHVGNKGKMKKNPPPSPEIKEYNSIHSCESVYKNFHLHALVQPCPCSFHNLALFMWP
jgi:hypothetical protein